MSKTKGFKYYKIEDNTIKISRDKDINEGWKKLKVDGLMTFNIVTNVDGAKDIRVALYKNNEYKIPALLFLSNYINEFNYEFNSEGLCLGKAFNRYTIVQDDLVKLSKVNSIEYTESIAVYKEDSFKNIYDQLINKDIFNDALKELNEAFKSMNTTIKVIDNLYDFMEANTFSYDYDNEFNIEHIDFKFELDNETLSNKEEFENYLGVSVTQLVIVKYNRIIVLEDINKNYSLVRDNTDTLYVVSYLIGNLIIDDNNEDLIEWNDQFN